MKKSAAANTNPSWCGTFVRIDARGVRNWAHKHKDHECPLPARKARVAVDEGQAVREECTNDGREVAEHGDGRHPDRDLVRTIPRHKLGQDSGPKSGLKTIEDVG